MDNKSVFSEALNVTVPINYSMFALVYQELILQSLNICIFLSDIFIN